MQPALVLSQLGEPAAEIGVVGTEVGGDLPKNGKSGAAPITRFDAKLFKTRFACELKGFDPTNGVLTQTDHIRVAVGRVYGDATPTSGTIFVGGGGETLEVDVRVEPIAGGGPRGGALED